jgi:purine-nucleoside phosphorylase
MSPIHVRGKPGEVAERVLLPGDPGRAEWIAKTFLQDPVLYTSHRGLLGYTGRYKGVPVSVQTTGMGAPSASIVAEELIGLGARVLLRVGTCGAVDEGLAPGDLVIAQGAVPLDGASRQYLEGRPYAPLPDAGLFVALWR